METGPATQETDFTASRRDTGASAASYQSLPPALPVADDEETATTATTTVTTNTSNYNDNSSHDFHPSSSSSSSSFATRAVAPDLLRGLLMVIMALDHANIALKAWGHGQGREAEADGQVVEHWDPALGFAVRTLTDLCAPGFTFLLGMGVVYFGRSRARLGWSPARMLRHFAVRAAILTLLCSAMPFLVSAGAMWWANPVLFALGVDYVLAGMLWIAFQTSEPALARLIDAAVGDVPRDWQQGRRRTAAAADTDTDTDTTPLIRRAAPRQGGCPPSSDITTTSKAATQRSLAISWHLHNAATLALALVTIWWNVWLSPNGGHCAAESSQSLTAVTTTTNSISDSFFVRVWLYPIFSERIFNGFPPLAWLSFALLGLLYGRAVTATTTSPSSSSSSSSSSPPSPPRRLLSPAFIRGATLLAALLSAALFVATRLLRAGNLSEGCLRAPEHAALAPGANPYLASPQSFFYLVKYPPDVAFFAFTMAGNLLLLAALESVPSSVTTTPTSSTSASHPSLPLRLARAAAHLLLTYGTSALFFYLVHQTLLMLGGALIVALLGRVNPDVPDTRNPGHPARGVASPAVFFALWAAALAALYPLCRWYGAFKGRKGVDSVWRFF